jgi:hypothetical protein
MVFGQAFALVSEHDDGKLIFETVSVNYKFKSGCTNSSALHATSSKDLPSWTPSYGFLQLTLAE